MKKLILVLALAATALGVFQSESSAVVVPFTRITSEAPIDIAGQLSAIVSSVDENHIKFEFHNSAVIASSITDIYFDDGGPNPPAFLENLSSIIDYQTLFEAGASPANLWGGDSLTPPFSADLAAQAKSPTAIINGVDNAADYVGLIFLLKPAVSFDDVAAALNNRSLRIGLYVQGIQIPSSSSGSCGCGTITDSFVSVPEPATICLLGLGALSLVRRKK